MRRTKYTTTVITLLLVFMMVLSSCNNIYKKGVDYDEYPEKDLPIYDDAIVFEYEYDDDDEECKIAYGVTDDVDDVADFYQELFEDEDYVIAEESVDKDEYKCEGYIDDIYFEIEVEESKRDEAEYFDCIVNIEISEYKEESASDMEQPEKEESLNEKTESAETDAAITDTAVYDDTDMENLTDMQKKMIGFWVVKSIQLGEASLLPEGSAYEFTPAGCFIYTNYIAPMENPILWEQTGENEITLGGINIYTIEFESENLVLTTVGNTINESQNCYLSDKEDFIKNSPQIDASNYYGNENLYNTWIDNAGSGYEITFEFPIGKDEFGNPVGKFTSNYYGEGDYVYLLQYNGIMITPVDGEDAGFSYSDASEALYGVDFTLEIKK